MGAPFLRVWRFFSSCLAFLLFVSGVSSLRVWRFFVSSSRGVDERVSLSATRVSFSRRKCVTRRGNRHVFGGEETSAQHSEQ